MLLAIDAGNTNTVFALFDGARGDQPVAVWRSATDTQRTSDDYTVFLDTLMRARNLSPVAVSAAIIGSVVPEVNFNLTKLCRDRFNCEPLIVGAPGVDCGVKILLDRPEDIGADRIINAVGGLSRYAPPLLLIDFGTATTFDVVNARGEYAGGAIAPGINLSLQALHMAAAKLPRVGIAPPAKVIGTNTVEAIRSGVYWGYAGLIEGMIGRIKREYAATDQAAKMTVIATGGLAKLFAPAVSGIDHFDDQLTLRGLHRIYQQHRTQKAA